LGVRELEHLFSSFREDQNDSLVYELLFMVIVKGATPFSGVLHAARRGLAII